MTSLAAKAEKIAQTFPREGRRLLARVEREGLPEAPPDELQALEDEACSLIDGETFDLPATKGRPFVVVCSVRWEDGDYPSPIEVIRINPRPGASASEKRLFGFLQSWVQYYDTWEDDLAGDISGAAVKSKPYQAFLKRIKAVLRKGEQLEKKYNFDLQQWLDYRF